MVKIRLQPERAKELSGLLESSRSAERTDHWRMYGALNEIAIQGNVASLRAGSGFDSEYELNFRPLSLRERVGRILKGTPDLDKYRQAYVSLWREEPRECHSCQRILAEHYIRFLPRCERYIEIGAGSGYLAALAHERFGCEVTIIDLPEILPFSMLYLGKRFPGTFFTFRTPGNIGDLGPFDLAVNTASFGEMPPAEISRYFAFLRSTAKSLFTVNRVEKFGVRFDSYPWQDGDEHMIDTASEFHALVQPSPMMLRLTRLATSSDALGTG